MITFTSLSSPSSRRTPPPPGRAPRTAGGRTQPPRPQPSGSRWARPRRRPPATARSAGDKETCCYTLLEVWDVLGLEKSSRQVLPCPCFQVNVRPGVMRPVLRPGSPSQCRHQPPPCFQHNGGRWCTGRGEIMSQREITFTYACIKKSYVFYGRF